MNNIEIPGFNVNAPTCGIGVSESNEVSLETNNVEYVEEGVKVEPTYSNAPNTSDTYTESSSDTASFEMKMGPLMDIEKMRGLLITSALSAVSATENYIYLKPSSNERDAAKITKLANVTGEISGGDCLKKMYNNERCVTIDGKSYYGADCNSFVSSIYHKILGFSNDTSMRFFYPSGSKWYLDGDNDGKYFDTTYYGSSLDKLLANAEPGDAIARSCANNSTHIGMYYRKVNNTHYVIDNGGWTGAKQRFNPIRTATIDEFIGVATNCKYTLFKLREDV